MLVRSWDGYVHPSISRPQDVIDQKIEDGSDCRTTLMVRNLPANYTKQDFLRLLNTYCPGKFDFAYNRIDSNKNQSVRWVRVRQSHLCDLAAGVRQGFVFCAGVNKEMMTADNINSKHP